MAAPPPRCNISLNATVNDIVSCVENGSLIGIEADSASPTDVYIFEFNPNTYFRNDKVERGFMKVFVSNPQFPSLNGHFADETEALNYEINVYQKTKELVNNNVIGHFVTYFTNMITSTKFNNLKNFIRDKANMSDSQATTNLKRNTIYMLYNQNSTRPAINDNTLAATNPVNMSISKINDVRYKFILTEAVMPYSISSATIQDRIQRLKNMPFNHSLKLSSINLSLENFTDCSAANLSDCNYLRDTLLEIYFQLAVTTYAMSLNHFVHNDLHDGNVWIKRTAPKNIKYTLKQVNGSPSYTLTNCINFSMLYDYDRAYNNKKAANRFLNGLEVYNQSNDIIEQRDFIKILCYFMKSLLPSLTKIPSTRSSKVSNKDNIKSQIYDSLLDCICKKTDTTRGFVNVPRSDMGNLWRANRVRWPNDDDRYKDFWDSIFNNIVVSPRGITMNNYSCFLNEAPGQIIKEQYGFLRPEIYTETLYPMPVIIDNLANLINTYTPGKIRKNERADGDYNYNVRDLSQPQQESLLTRLLSIFY